MISLIIHLQRLPVQDLKLKKGNQKLIPHTVITNSLSRTSSQFDSLVASTLHFHTRNMADQTLLVKARKVRVDDLPNFSENPSEDVERFLKSIKHITKATDASNNHEILEILRDKLNRSAGVWFDNNESIFKKCSDFETAF